MKNKLWLKTAGAGVVVLTLVQSLQALPVSLGSAGPGNWAVLEIGNGNLSIANASSAGYIHGNVGVGSGGNGSDSGTPISGNVVTYDTVVAAVNPNVAANVSGTISQNTALLASAASAAIAASTAAAGLSSSDGGVGVSVINYNDGLTHNLSAGVYNLSGLTLQNGSVLNLLAGGSYVFNISGNLALNSSSILTSLGLSESEVLFNIIGGHDFSTSGGLGSESVLHGIVLDVTGNINETPGLVVGEIIGGKNINIASGAQVQGVPNVPDAASTAGLLGLGLVALAVFRRGFAAKHAFARAN